jgi:hypothetical protein
VRNMLNRRWNQQERSGRQVEAHFACDDHCSALDHQMGFEKTMGVSNQSLPPHRVCKLFQVETSADAAGHMQGLVNHGPHYIASPPHKMQCLGAPDEMVLAASTHSLAEVETHTSAKEVIYAAQCDTDRSAR